VGVLPLLDEEFVARRVRAPSRDVVFVKAVIEASEGLAAMFAERGGDLTLVAHRSQEKELDRLIVDLERERLLERVRCDSDEDGDHAGRRASGQSGEASARTGEADA
jgi:hypothetical protein